VAWPGRPLRPWGCGDRLRAGQAACAGAGGFEEVHPLGLAVPAFEQVHGDVAVAVAGDPGGDADEVTAQRGGPGPGAGQAGQRPGGAQQVMADGGTGQPAAFAGNDPKGRWPSGPSARSANTCSTWAWSRWCSSAWTVANGESVNS
jgi:hypothetical protein